MIVPMLKYSFLVFHKEYDSFLQQLQEIGLVHIDVKKHELSDDNRQQLQVINHAHDTVKFLDTKISKKKTDLIPTPTHKNGEQVIELIQSLKSERDLLTIDNIHLNRELNSLEPWGEYNSETINQLVNSKANIRFFNCSEKKYEQEWENQFDLFFINQIDSEIYFIIINHQNQEINIDADEFIFPKKSSQEIREAIQNKANRIFEIEKRIEKIAFESKITIEKFIEEKNNILSLAVASENGIKEVNDKVMFIEGWLPKEKEAEINQFLAVNPIVYTNKDAKYFPPEQVPVLLKNNKFAKLFEFIGSLYSLPRYGELDMTPYFAPFFALFFGFCLADVGYGLLYLILGTVLKPKMKAEYKPFLTLAQVFGVTTIIFGLLSGTFFGINLLEVSMLGDFRKYILAPEKLFNIALMIGVIQILFGMFVKIGNRTIQFGFKYALSTLGWIILIIASLAFYGLKLNPETFKIPYFITMGLSSILIIFFVDPKESYLMNFGLGLWDVYGMVTGLMGDVLSYIRLFALGISSAILGVVFNDIAMSTLSTPFLGPVFFLIIILFGHGLNLFMSSLGSFVHPMRLTFVEFYKNAGFTGGGKAYNPLKK